MWSSMTHRRGRKYDREWREGCAGRWLRDIVIAGRWSPDPGVVRSVTVRYGCRERMQMAGLVCMPESPGTCDSSLLSPGLQHGMMCAMFSYQFVRSDNFLLDELEG